MFSIVANLSHLAGSVSELVCDIYDLVSDMPNSAVEYLILEYIFFNGSVYIHMHIFTIFISR